jgi:hypothetical protein
MLGSCPRHQAGKATEARCDFRWRGGTPMISRRIRPAHHRQFRGDELVIQLSANGVRGLSSRKQARMPQHRRTAQDGIADAHPGFRLSESDPSRSYSLVPRTGEGRRSAAPRLSTEPACGCHRIGRFARSDDTISPPSPVKGSVSAKPGATPPRMAFRASCCT